MVIDKYEGPASQASIDGLVGQVDDALEAAGYYHVPARVASSNRTLRTLLTRPGWSEKEVRTLRGLVPALVGGRRGVRPRGPSDERRVGTECGRNCRYRWSPAPDKKKQYHSQA